MTPRDLPILFSGAMVRKILDNRKTNTRRPVKLRDFAPSDTTGYDWTFRDRRALWQDYRHADLLARVAPCRAGDRLYVRETFSQAQTVIYYRADEAGLLPPGEKWTPSIHMPRCAARIWLRVERVRVERACDISEVDAQAEGFDPVHGEWAGPREEGRHWSARKPFHDAWISMYGRAAWQSWCWVYDFSRIEVSSC
jgi:hypothetical protein